VTHEAAAGSERTEGSPAPPAQAVVTLVGLPRGATLTVDGSPVVGPTFALALGQEPVEVVVRARGFAPWRRRVDARGDTVVAVRLRPAGPERPAAPPAPAPPLRDEALQGTIGAFGQMP
jgi:hypothetical protein